MVTYMVVSSDLDSKKVLMLEYFRTQMPAMSGSSATAFTPFTSIDVFQPVGIFP